MIKKLFILLIILTTTTSAQSQTYEERLLGAKFFFSQKNYEKAKNILLPLIKNLDKANIKSSKRIILYESLGTIVDIYKYERDWTNIEKYLIKYIKQCKILSKKKPNYKMFFGDSNIICQWHETTLGHTYIVSGKHEKGIKIYENLINKENDIYNSIEIKLADKKYKMGRRFDLYDYYRRANKNNKAEKYIYELLSFINLQDLKSKRENYNYLLVVYEYFANRGGKKNEAINGMEEIIKDLKDQGRQNSFIYIKSLSAFSDILNKEYYFIDGTAPHLQPTIKRTIKLLNEAITIHEKRNANDSKVIDNKDSLVLYYRLGIRYAQLGQFSEAEKLFYKSIKNRFVDKNFADFVALATTQIFLNKFNDAKNNLIKAEKIFNKHYNKDSVQQVGIYRGFLNLYSMEGFRNISKFTDYYIKYYNYVSKKNKNLFSLSEQSKYSFASYTDPLYSQFFRRFNDDEIKNISDYFKSKTSHYIEDSIIELTEIAKGTKINSRIANLIERSKDPNIAKDKKDLQNLLIEYRKSPKISKITKDQDEIFNNLLVLQNKIQNKKNLILNKINQSNNSNFLHGLSAENIQKNLSNDQAIISYYNYLVIIITREKTYFKYLLPNEEKFIGGRKQNLIKNIHNSNKVINNIIPDFDIKSSQNLYELIIKPIKYLIDNKKELFIVPDATLLSLPFEILIDSKEELANIKNYKNINWFGKKHIISYYPSIFSFYNLKQIKFDPTKEKISFLGFGDPKFKTDKKIKTTKINYSKMMARGIANADEIRKMDELPETREELAFIANLFKNNSKLYLGEEFNEDIVKSISLRDYKYISFATHAIVADQIINIIEPGLILSPPEKSTKENDGILTISEIEKLYLESDVVILSACNTASEDSLTTAQGLSGLASAFFQAGTKSILVTHWDVETNSAVQLTTGTFDKMQSTNNLSQALQQTKIEMMNNDESSHPLFWAPFVLIGNVANQ